MLVEANNTYFSQNIRYLRKKKHWSKESLAVKVGIPIDTLEQIENGTAPMAVEYEVLLRFREVFHDSLENLFHADLSI